MSTESDRILTAACRIAPRVLTAEPVVAFYGVSRTETAIAFDRVLGAKRSLIIQRSMPIAVTEMRRTIFQLMIMQYKVLKKIIIIHHTIFKKKVSIESCNSFIDNFEIDIRINVEKINLKLIVIVEFPNKIQLIKYLLNLSKNNQDYDETKLSMGFLCFWSQVYG